MENAPSHANGSMNAPRSAGSGHESPRSIKKRISKLKIISIIVGVFALVVLSLSVWIVVRSGSLNIEGDKYQAVFLTNGQVYFGKLSQVDGNYFKLNDIFYLQAQDDTNKSDVQDASTNTSDVQLIKLGNEIHGPDDQMTISKDQVLFFENLKKDGKVARSIEEYKTKK
jgi:hypothetical protein